MNSNRLQEHIQGTYTRLRRGMGVIALLLPFVLWIGGRIWLDTSLQTSISAYYHTTDDLRDILVGVLFAIGTFLFLYKGEDRREDWLLNIAGISALGIAYFEVAKGSDCSPTPQGMTLHGFFAVVFFIAITWVCVMVALRPQQQHVRYLARHAWYYNLCAVAMLLSMAVGLMYAFLLPESIRLVLCNHNIIFWVEAVGVWAFSAFWLLRTMELDASASWLPWVGTSARPGSSTQ